MLRKIMRSGQKDCIIVQCSNLELRVKKTTLVVLYYIIMKKLGCLFIVLLVSIAGFSQTDTSLARRLKEYTRFSKELNFDELMELVHPSLFDLAPKEQLMESFRSIYENEAIKMTIEKRENRSISNPFALNGVQYCKIDYDMVLNMKFKDESLLEDSTEINKAVSALKEVLAGKEVSYNASSKQFIIKGSDVLIAIKDDSKTPWLFLGYDGTNELIRKLFPEEMIEHFKLQ